MFKQRKMKKISVVVLDSMSEKDRLEDTSNEPVFSYCCDDKEGIKEGDLVNAPDNWEDTLLQVVKVDEIQGGLGRLKPLKIKKIIKKEEIKSIKKVMATEKEVIDVDVEEVPSTKEEKQTKQRRVGKMIDGVDALVNNVLVKISADEITEQVYPEIDKRIKDTYGFLPQVHKIVAPNKKSVLLKEAVHEKFDEVLNIVNNDIPVFLTGKAGTGKNVICKQVAKALGLNFYFTNAVTQEYKLTGFIDGYGKYHETEFYKAFTKGGVFFLDEIDASIPETLVILNAAIANRYFDFPNGKVEAHKDFRVIAAGNTTGNGADNDYTGRYCLDEASLDRFVLIEIGYSQTIEKVLCCDNVELISFAHAFREVVEKAGIRCLCSYRAIERISKLESAINMQELLRICLLRGLNVDDINIIKNEMRNKNGMNNNKYGKELINYQAVCAA